EGMLTSDIFKERPGWELYRDGCPDGEAPGDVAARADRFLARAGRTDPARLAEARLLFEQMLGYGNHLGLYAEQTGPSGETLGSFPQAFTHLALISAAFNLDRALADRAD